MIYMGFSKNMRPRLCELSKMLSAILQDHIKDHIMVNARLLNKDLENLLSCLPKTIRTLLIEGLYDSTFEITKV